MKREIILTFAALIASSAAIVAVTLFPRIWSPEHRLSDWMVTFFAPVKEIDPDIVIVTIRDDIEHRKRLSSLLPTDRAHLARLTDCLSEGGASVIGFDMLFDWPDARGLAELERSIAAASETTPVVIGVTDASSDDPTGSASRREIERFARSANAKVGVIDLLQSGGQGTVRTAIGDKGTEPAQTFSTSVAQWSGLAIGNQRPYESPSFRIAWSHASEEKNGQPVHFTDIASLDVLDICSEFGASSLKPMIGGKIVLVGSRAQRDHYTVPFSTLPEYSNGMSGIEIHATIIAQVLRGPNIIVPGWIWTFVIAIFASVIGLFVHNNPALRSRKKFVLVGIGFLITMLAWLFFAVGHILLPLALILIAITNGAFIEQTASEVYLLYKRARKRLGLGFQDERSS